MTLDERIAEALPCQLAPDRGPCLCRCHDGIDDDIHLNTCMAPYRPAVRKLLAGYEAELTALREMVQIERELLHGDVIFYGTGPDGKPHRCILISDTFAYACADAESLSDDELREFYAFWREHGDAGATAWVADKRGMEPIPPACTDEYQRARVALNRARKLTSRGRGEEGGHDGSR